MLAEQDNDPEGGGRETALRELLRELQALRHAIVAETGESRQRVEAVHAEYRASAVNLLHYLALRRRDLRPLQHRLAALGLSSLGRAESHVLATLDAVLAMLRTVIDMPAATATAADDIDFSAGKHLLTTHTDALFGPARPERNVRIMVTMPSAAADDYQLVHDLLADGMDSIRINCAHDDAATWSRVIDNLRRAEQSLGRRCKVAMDLAGPKLRTGPLEPGPQVLRVHPQRDVFGRIVAPARIWLTPASAPRPAPGTAQACLAVPLLWLVRLHEDDQVTLTDARGAKRSMSVREGGSDGRWLEADKTAYLVPGTVLRHRRHGHKGKGKATCIDNLPPRENAILLHKGDRLVVTRRLDPGRPAELDAAGQMLTPATIGCTLPDVFDAVRAGESIWFDDGKIGGMIEQVEPERMHVRITQARARGDKLRADKGINLPDSALTLPALTPKDMTDLAFVARHADIVQLSFANRAADVAALQEALTRLGERQPAIVLKIETRCGFDNLPDMLLTAMRSPCCGVMIARGDLAVESGFGRLAEVQEEMLWVCEAAHVPVIWATQVLESLARDGRPSRAEITDAAMADRAECVMLNKGPYIVDAVRTLDDILKRMQAHQDKKQPMLRMLKLAHASALVDADGTETVSSRTSK